MVAAFIAGTLCSLRSRRSAPRDGAWLDSKTLHGTLSIAPECASRRTRPGSQLLHSPGRTVFDRGLLSLYRSPRDQAAGRTCGDRDPPAVPRRDIRGFEARAVRPLTGTTGHALVW